MPSSGTLTDIDPVRAAELLVAARQGCADSLQSLVVLCSRTCGVKRRHAWRRDQIDDVVQDVWVQLLAHASQIRDPQTLIAWLSTVTRHVALRVGGRETRSIAQEIEDTSPGSDSAEDDALARLRRDEVTGGVRQALDRLEDADRTLLLLLHHDDRPGYAAIGTRVNRPVGSLGPTRQRLLHRLRGDQDISRLETLVTAA